MKNRLARQLPGVVRPKPPAPGVNHTQAEAFENIEGITMVKLSLAIVLASVCACAAALIPASSARGAVMVTDVMATDAQGNTYSANAAFGLFAGNDTGNQGTALPYLNSGALGEEFDDIEWTYAGKSEANELNPFTIATPDGTTSGTLTFDEVYSGAFAISLKAGNNHAIYVFEELSNIVSITYTTQAFVNHQGNAKALSHASLFVGQPTLPSPEPTPFSNPEPTSLVIFALGAATLGLGYRRRLA
jgi:hypothetical protein